MSENQSENPADEQSLPQDSTNAVDQVFEEQGTMEENETIDDAQNQNDAGNMDTNDVESLKNQLAEKADQLLRSAAETENVRKRGRREVEEARKYASAGLLSDLLTVLDDLKRALDAAEQNQEGQGLLSGVKMVASQLESVLEKHHCKKIDALGNPFDPNLHEAIQMQPSADVDAGHVSVETRTGYQLHDRILRTAQVFVSTGNPEAAAGDSASDE